MKHAPSSNYLLRNISIRSQFFTATFCMVIFFFFIFSIISYNAALRSFESQTRYASEKALTQTRGYLESKISAVLYAVNMIGLNPSVESIFVNPPSYYNNSAALWIRDTDFVTSLNTSFYTNNDITQYAYISKNGICNNDVGIGSMNPSYQFVSESLFQDEAWLMNLENSRQTYVWLPSGVYPWNGNADCITLIRKIQDLDNLRGYVGMVVTRIPISVFTGILDNAAYSAGTSLYIINSDDQLIASSTGAKDNYLKLENALNGSLEENGNTVIVHIDSEASLVARDMLSGSDWRVVISVPYTRTVGELSISMLKSNLIIIACLIPVCLLLSLLMASFTTRPIQALKAHMMAGGQDKPSSTLPSEGKNEIAVLTRSYNHLLEQFSDSLDKQYILGQEVKAQELKALQAQINPHFLYNTLELICWMSLSADAPEIVDLVHSMADFYKLSLRGGADTSNVQQEIDHVKAYMAVQNVRFDDKIILHIDLPQEILSCSIPKLTFQPLIENAILHGIMERDNERGNIIITGELSGNDALIYITDDGIGMSKDHCLALFDKELTLNGYGVNNIHSRLVMCFGEGYGLHFESEPMRGTRVTIRIPGP